MYGCESWAIKKAEHWRIDAFELWYWRRLLRVPWIQPVNHKGNQSWIFTGRIDVEAEAPVLWPPDMKGQLIEKNSDAGNDWRQEKGWQRMRWLHGITDLSDEQAPGVGDGQGSLLCCSPWGCKESDTTKQLNWLTDKQQAVRIWPTCRVSQLPVDKH